MSTVLLISRLALAAVFAVAGIAKLLDRDGSRRAATDFGVPAAAAGVLAVGVPLLELAAAALLLPQSTALAGAALAAVLLAGFSAAIVRQVMQGRAPDCHCFGQLHSAPAGPATLARNGALLGVAAFVVVGTVAHGDAGTSATDWTSSASAPASASAESVVAAAAVLVAVAALAVVVSLLRRHGALLLRADALETALAEHGIAVAGETDAPDTGPVAIERGLPADTPAPAFSLPRADGGTASLDDLLAEREGALLVFADPQCGPCNALMPDVARWQRALAGDVEVAVVTRPGGSAKDGVANVLIQSDREVAAAYEVSGTPSAVVVDADGRIASSLAEGAEAIKQLVAELGIGDGPDTVPELRIVQAGGATEAPAAAPADIDLALDGETVLLFWRSTCGFCDRMLPELREFAARPGSERRPMVVVTGAGDAGPDVGLRVLEEPSGRLADAYGARGTPMAVLVDADGRALGPVARGAQAALELAALPTSSGGVSPEAQTA